MTRVIPAGGSWIFGPAPTFQGSILFPGTSQIQEHIWPLRRRPFAGMNDELSVSVNRPRGMERHTLRSRREMPQGPSRVTLCSRLTTHLRAHSTHTCPPVSLTVSSCVMAPADVPPKPWRRTDGRVCAENERLPRGGRCLWETVQTASASSRGVGPPSQETP